MLLEWYRLFYKVWCIANADIVPKNTPEVRSTLPMLLNMATQIKPTEYVSLFLIGRGVGTEGYIKEEMLSIACLFVLVTSGNGQSKSKKLLDRHPWDSEIIWHEDLKI